MLYYFEIPNEPINRLFFNTLMRVICFLTANSSNVKITQQSDYYTRNSPDPLSMVIVKNISVSFTKESFITLLVCARQAKSS